MRFDRVILHIGLGKTGSSAIQQALLRHADDLESNNGVLVPRGIDDPRPFAGNHSVYLRSLCSERPHELRVNIAAGLGDAKQLQRVDAALRQQYESIFSSSSAKTLLLSAEGIGHFDRASTQTLARWLQGLGTKVEVIACVRHPRHALAAEIQQRLKTGAVLERLYQRPPFYRYSELFSRIADAFGKESLQLYDYAEVVSADGAAVGTFFEKIGLAPAELEADRALVNTGLSHMATLLLDSLNRQRPLFVEGRRNPLRKQGDIAAFFNISGEPFRPPAAVYSLLNEMIGPELTWLQENYDLTLDAMSEELTPRQETMVGDTVLEIAEIDTLALRLADSA